MLIDLARAFKLLKCSRRRWKREPWNPYIESHLPKFEVTLHISYNSACRNWYNAMRFSAAGWARFGRDAVLYLIARARCQRIEQSEAAKLRNLSKRRENQFYHTIQNRAAARAFTPWFCVLTASWRTSLTFCCDFQIDDVTSVIELKTSNFTLGLNLQR